MNHRSAYPRMPVGPTDYTHIPWQKIERLPLTGIA